MRIFSTAWLDKLKTLFGITKYQVKILPSSVNATSNDITSLKFQNLVIGRIYRLSVQVAMNGTAAGSTGGIYYYNSNSVTDPAPAPVLSNYQAGAISTRDSLTTVFKATGTVLFCTFGNVNQQRIVGDGARSQTFSILEELPNHTETSEW